MDELAEKMGMDPLELRYQNVYRPGDTTPTGQTPEVYSFPRDVRHAAPAVQGRQGEGQGRIHRRTTRRAWASPSASTAAASTAPTPPRPGSNSTKDGRDGRHHLAGSRPGRGHGRRGHGARGAAPAWDSTPDQIKLVLNDTALAPNSGPSGGSRSQVVTGNAIKNGCEMLLDAMRKPDGTFRTYDEMVAEKIPLRYVGQVDGLDAPSLRRERPGRALLHLHVRRLHGRSGGGHEDRQDHGREA